MKVALTMGMLLLRTIVCMLIALTWLVEPALVVAAPNSQRVISSAGGAPKVKSVSRFKRFMGRLLHLRRKPAPVAVVPVSTGNRFKHNPDVNTPKSKSNQEVLPIQVLKVYWVRGDVPAQARELGVDIRGQESWPQPPQAVR